MKFRAWHKQNRFWINVAWISFSEQTLGDGNGGNWRFQEVELVQFTGLYDKNGEEIYEGDIVEFNKSGKYVAVDWNSRGGCWVVGESVLGRASSSSEVIGNIYENPELLKS